jgi:hypothetical protein
LFSNHRDLSLLITLIVFLGLGCKKNTSQNPAPIVLKTADTTTFVTGSKPVVKTNTQKIYVHYMPWFETPATSGTGQ